MPYSQSATGFEIVRREDFCETTFLLAVRHPMMARVAHPGQFVIVMSHPDGERIPLTLADFDMADGTISLVIQAVGKSTREMQRNCQAGTQLHALVGPMGLPSRLGEGRTVLCVGGGPGGAPIYPMARAYKRQGATVIGVLGFRTARQIFWESRYRALCDELILCTDDGSAGLHGLVSEGIRQAIEAHPDVDQVVAIGPPVMMQACAEATRPHGIRTTVNLNPIMVDGTGLCGSCRVKVGGVVKFACVEGPDFDAHLVDFDELMSRLRHHRAIEEAATIRWSGSETAGCALWFRRPERSDDQRRSPYNKRTIHSIPRQRTPVRVQDRVDRRSNFDEVTLGYDAAEAQREAERCLLCAAPACVAGCPVGVDIPGFIAHISAGDLRSAYDAVARTNLLPAVCGRVCPQEIQCEGAGVLGGALEPVAIGMLERYVGDRAIAEGWAQPPHIEPNRFYVAVVGSGPAGWPAPPTWRAPAARSRSMTRSTCPAACCATASPISACPTRWSTPRSRRCAGWAWRSSATPWSDGCSPSTR